MQVLGRQFTSKTCCSNALLCANEASAELNVAFLYILTVQTLEMYLLCKIAIKTSIFTICNLFSAAHYLIKTLSISRVQLHALLFSNNARYSASTRAPAAKLKRRVVITRAHFLARTNALAG
jgi:hypothetical protein